MSARSPVLDLVTTVLEIVAVALLVLGAGVTVAALVGGLIGTGCGLLVASVASVIARIALEMVATR